MKIILLIIGHSALIVQSPQKFNQDQDHKTMATICQDRYNGVRLCYSVHIVAFYTGVPNGHQIDNKF